VSDRDAAAAFFETDLRVPVEIGHHYKAMAYEEQLKRMEGKIADKQEIIDERKMEQVMNYHLDQLDLNNQPLKDELDAAQDAHGLVLELAKRDDSTDDDQRALRDETEKLDEVTRRMDMKIFERNYMARLRSTDQRAASKEARRVLRGKRPRGPR
jgi:hypothetical protein